MALGRGLDTPGLGEPKFRDNTVVFNHSAWIFFTGYSESHFICGEWDLGPAQCLPTVRSPTVVGEGVDQCSEGQCG